MRGVGPNTNSDMETVGCSRPESVKRQNPALLQWNEKN